MPATPNETYDVLLRVKADGDEDLKALTKAMQSLQDEAKKSQKSLDTVAKSVSGWGLAIKNSIANFGTNLITGAISGAFNTISESITGVIDDLGDLSDASQKFGISTEELSALRYVGEQAGVGFEELTKGAAKFATAIADVKGKAGFATTELRKLGITANTDLTTALIKVSDQFANMADGAQKVALARELFGKTGADLIPLLNQGSAAIKQQADEAERYGIIVDQQAADAAEAFGDNMKRLESAAHGLWVQLVQQSTPALLAITNVMVDGAGAGDDMKKATEGIGPILIDIAKGAVSAANELRKFAFVTGTIYDALKENRGVITTYDQITAGLARIDKQTESTIAALDKAFKKAKEAPPPVPRTPTGDLGAETKAAADAARTAKKAGDAAQKEAEERVKKVNELTVRFRESVADVLQANDKAVADYVDTLNRAADPTIAYVEGMERLAEAQRTALPGTLAATAAFQEQLRLYRELIAARAAGAGDLVADFNKSMEALIADNEATAKSIEGVWGSMAQSVIDAGASIAASAGRTRDIFRTLVADLLKELARLAVYNIFKGAAAGSIGAGIAKAFKPAALGAVFNPAGLVPFQKGGIVDGPTVFPFANGVGLMGEAGPEAIVPLQRDAQGRLGVSSQPVQINVINQTGAAVEVKETGPGQVDIIISRAVAASRTAIAQDVARGGNDVARSMERTYGVNRAAGAF